MSNESRNLSVPADEPAPSYSLLPDALVDSVPQTLLDHGAKTRDVLVFSSAYLVFVAMGIVATVMLALSLPLSPAPFVVGLVAFSVYVGDRIADADADEATNPEQAAFVTRHESTLSVLTAVSYGIAVALSITGGPLALAVTLVPGAFWVCYATDWLPSLGSRFQRLKDVFVVNSAIVAGAWAVSVVLLPLAFAGVSFTTTAAVVFVYVFLDVFANTEIPNVRDMEGDADIGVSTLPVVLGVRRTRHVLYALNCFLVCFVAAAFVVGLLSVAVTVAILAGLGASLVITAFVGRTDRYGLLTVAGEAKAFGVFVVAACLTLVGL